MLRRPGLWLAVALGGAAVAVPLVWWNGTGKRVSERSPRFEEVAGSRSRDGEDPGDAYRDEVAALLRVGQLTAVEEVIDEWLARVPRDERALLARAELVARQGRRAEAIDLFTGLLSRSSESARIWLRLADLHESMGQQEAAIRCCRESVTAAPDEDEARIRLGDLLRIVGRLDEAAEVLEPLLKRNPNSLQVRHALAAVRNGQGRFEEVVRLIDPLLEDAVLPRNARQHLAVALGELGRRAEAADVWTTILETDPFDAEGYYRLGRLARRLGRRELAAAMLSRYEELEAYEERLESARKLDLSGRLDLASLERAEACADTGQVRLAVGHYRLAIKASGGNPDLAVRATLSLIRLDLLPEAAELIDGLRSSSDAPGGVAEAMAGLLAEREGELEAAVASYEKALESRPDYRQVRLALNRIRQEQSDRAAEAEGQAAARELKNRITGIRRQLRTQSAVERSRSYLELAGLAAQRGNREKQLSYLGAAIHLDPKNPEAYRRLVDANMELRDLFLRLNALGRLAALRGSDAAVQRQFAESYTGADLRGDRAVLHAEAVVRLAPGAPASALLARALLAVDRPDEALHHARRAAELDGASYDELVRRIEARRQSER